MSEGRELARAGAVSVREPRESHGVSSVSLLETCGLLRAGGVSIRVEDVLLVR